MFEKIVDKDKKLTTITVSWKSDFDELMIVLKSFLNDNKTEHLLLDLSDSFLDDITYDHVVDLCKYAAYRDNGTSKITGKTALVSSSSLQSEIGRMFEAYFEIENSDINVAVFRSLEEALSWLEEDG
ncbi:MAG TPA: hypothetical protein VLM43_05570 [Desulfobacterales bacterium]|nr:hypothetical protein [Desulfobacterales bacterium]